MESLHLSCAGQFFSTSAVFELKTDRAVKPVFEGRHQRHVQAPVFLQCTAQQSTAQLTALREEPKTRSCATGNFTGVTPKKPKLRAIFFGACATPINHRVGSCKVTGF